MWADTNDETFYLGKMVSKFWDMYSRCVFLVSELRVELRVVGCGWADGRGHGCKMTKLFTWGKWFQNFGTCIPDVFS